MFHKRSTCSIESYWKRLSLFFIKLKLFVACLFAVLECGKLLQFPIFQHVFLFLLLFFFLKSRRFLLITYIGQPLMVASRFNLL